MTKTTKSTVAATTISNTRIQFQQLNPNTFTTTRSTTTITTSRLTIATTISDDRVQCVTTCQFYDGKGCKVKIINGPRGEEEGTCLPKSFGGQCYDIPEECFRGKDITSQCGSESWMDQSPCKEGTRYV